MRVNKWFVRPMVAAVGACFGTMPAWANPTGPQVMHGNVQMQGLGTNHLKVTNSPSSIIHWQGFSIGAGQITQFQQQSAASAVLNRVVGPDISSIHGQLLSNGQVFLINPAGIIVGPGGVIDTAGFVGSTLNMLNADFLSGKLRFEGGAGAGSIVNEGLIRAGQNGNVVLIAPSIENSGIVHSEGGEIILAAGQKATIGSLKLEGVQFEIQAPSDSALNLGKLLADDGAVGVFAGTLKHSGDIRASSISRDAAGRVVLKAQGDVTVAGGSTISANGGSGGDVLIQSSAGQTRVAGLISAEGFAGKGGDVRVLGGRVAVLDNATIDASGMAGGGTVRIGGDFQGKNPEVQNATSTFIGPQTQLFADSRGSGDGGRIIVWSDKSTRYFGSLYARGGPAGGNGGFAEVSGKEELVFLGNADLGAPRGRMGDLLLDPLDFFADVRGGLNPDLIDEATDYPGNAVTVSPDTLANINANVNLFASRHMRINSPIALTGGRSFTATVGTHNAANGAAVFTPDNPNVVGDQTVLEGTPPNQLELGASIMTDGGAVTLSAPSIRTFRSGAPLVPTEINTNGGNVTITSPGLISQLVGGTADRVNINAGTGAVNVTSEASSIAIGTVAGASFTASGRTGITTGDIATTGNTVRLTSVFDTMGGLVGGAISTGTVTTTGGDVTADAFSFIQTGVVQTAGGAVALDSRRSVVFTGNILAGSGNVTLRAGTDPLDACTFCSINTGTATTTGAVVLEAMGGDVFATVDNASSIIANATRSDPFSNVSTNVTSSAAATSPLNATRVTAQHTGCFNIFNCRSATVNITSNNATGVNLGEIVVDAATTANNNRNAAANVTANAGAIRALALPAGVMSHVTGETVSLRATLAGNGIGAAGAPVTIAANRQLTFETHGDFAAQVNGASGPNRLDVTLGVAAAGGNYSGSLTGGGVNLVVGNATNDTTVTLTDLTITEVGMGGFKNAVRNQNPAINLTVSDGALVAQSITVPEGGTVASGGAPLPVNITASGNLTVNSYTRQGASNPDSVAQQTNFTSNTGTVTLGSITGNKDAITVQAQGDVSIAASSIVTQSDVSVTSAAGSITVGVIDTSAGLGSVFLTTSCAENNSCGGTGGNIFALNDSAALEVNAGGDVKLNGQALGNPLHARPFDVTSGDFRQVTLRSPNASGHIGNGAGAPIVANTRRLIIEVPVQGPEFHVTTGTTDIQDLTVTIQPNGVSRVTSNGRVYDFEAGGGGLELGIDAASNTQFDDGTLSVTVPTGTINVQDNIDLTASGVLGGTAGVLVLKALQGSIDAAGRTLLAREITLHAGTEGTGTAATITAGNIGSAAFRPDSVTILAGHETCCTTSRVGSFESGEAVFGREISITTHGNPTSGISMQFGPNSNDAIGGAAVAQRANDVTLDARTIGGTSGSVNVGSIFADGEVKVGSQSNVAINGSLNGATIFLGGPINTSLQPIVTVNGAIGATVPVHSLTLKASNANIMGAITGDGAAMSTVDMTTTAGGLTLGGAITGFGQESTINLSTMNGPLNLGPAGAGRISAGTGSTITLGQTPATPTSVNFAQLDAPGGSVTISNSSGSIQQVGAASPGITADMVTLNANSGNILHVASDGNLDLNGVKNLFLSTSGSVGLDANGSTLELFSLTKSTNFGAAPFTLANLNGQTITFVNTASGTDLTVNSVTPLDFSFTYNAANGALTLAGGGIVTSGGSAIIHTQAAIDASAGINSTGTATPDTRGAVRLFSSGGSITAGPITTPGTATMDNVDPRAITLVTDCANCNIDIAGDIFSGAGGGPIVISAMNSGNITRSGNVTIRSESPASVRIFAQSGNIGAAGQALIIDSPRAVLSANGPAGGSLTAGNVFADLVNTTTSTQGLDVTAHNGFAITVNKPIDLLSVTTRGSGTGATMLTAPSQEFMFARPAMDLFGAVTETFEIINARGSGPTPVDPTRTNFAAIDGDLLVRGGASLTADNLRLDAQAGMVKLQGNNANPLTLTNALSQEIIAGGDIDARGRISLETGTQTIGSTNGNVFFTGGAADGEAIDLTASIRQHIFTSQASGGNVVFQGGDGDNASVTARFDGAFNNSLDPSDAEQQIEARGQVQVRGGPGDDTFGLFTANQRQLVRAGDNAGSGTVLVLGGDGPGSFGSIVGTGGMTQRIGEDRQTCCTLFPYQTVDVTFQAGPGMGAYASAVNDGPQFVHSRSGTVSLLGNGLNAHAEILGTGVGAQSVGGRAANVLLTAGGTAGAYSRLRAMNGFQTVTATTEITLTANAAGNGALIQGVGQSIQGGANLTLNAAAHPDAPAEIHSEAGQTLNVGTLMLNALGSRTKISASGIQNILAGDTTLNAGNAADATATISTDALAALGGFEQTLNLSDVTLNGGSAADAFAGIMAFNGDQRFSGFNTMILNGGTATGTFAGVTTALGMQRFDGFGNIILNAGNVAGPVANAGALIEGNSQSICVFGCGTITFNARAGLAGEGNASDALIRNLSGAQSVTPFQIIINGGTQFSSAGIVNVAENNAAPGAQTVTAFGGVALTGNATGAGADVFIRNELATLQTLNALGGGISVANTGSGNAGITSEGPQRTASLFVDVRTAAGSSGNSTISAVDNQWVATTNGTTAPMDGGSVSVVSRGSGIAGIDGGARQLFEVDYPNFMTTVPTAPGTLIIGAADAAGTSRIQGVDQNIFTRALTVEAGATPNTTSKLTGTNSQTISVLDGMLSVLGGLGANSLASVDPVTQTMVVNNSNGADPVAIAVTGGSTAGANADITAQTQTIAATRGRVQLTGATGTASIVSTAGPQLIDVAQLLALTGGAAAAAVSSAGGQNFNLGALTLTGNAQVTTTAGNQSINAMAIQLNGAQAGITTGIINEVGGGTQTVTSGGNIQLNLDPNAPATASVLIDNKPATAQTVTAGQDVILVSDGSGNVAVTSGGTQNVNARGLDVRTATNSTNANAGVQSIGDQTVTTTGSLAAEAGVGLRVASLGTGTAKVETAGNQNITVNGNQLLIGRLDFGPPGMGDSSFGNPAVGTSMVIAQSAVMTPNQTVTADSLYIQGPSTDRALPPPPLATCNSSCLKLVGAGTQTIALNSGLILIGGSGANALAVIDPGPQSITSVGDMWLQGGSGPNADALINATGPQTVQSTAGSITLVGGTGQGADALIVTTSPFQTVSAANGVFLIQGPAITGGMAGLQQGSNFDAAQIAASTLTGEILREQEELEEVREDVSGQQTEESGTAQKVPLCT